MPHQPVYAYAPPLPGGQPPARGWIRGVDHLVTSLPGRWRVALLTGLAGTLAALVGLVTAANPHASPAGAAVGLRVAIVAALFGAGIYAQTRRIQARMGALLVAGGVYASLWLVNGSSDGLLFTVGLLVSGLAPALFGYLVLAHPMGHLRTDRERRLLGAASATMFAAWVLLLLTSRQPAVHTPLLHCTPSCPDNLLYTGISSAGAVATVLKAVVLAAWAAIVMAAPVVIQLRMRRMSRARRATLRPVAFVASTNALLWFAFLFAEAARSGASENVGAMYVGCIAVIPLAILVGLGLERLSMGGALADFATSLARSPGADAELLLGRAIGDPTLRIAYFRDRQRRPVDATGAEMPIRSQEEGRIVSWVARGRTPVAAIVYDADLAEQGRFVEAAGNVASLHLDNARLKASLLASSSEIAASRIRMVEAADGERRRLERDLHDGVQQQVIGMRIRLDIATESMGDESDETRRMMSVLGRQMDELLGTLRSFARGVYPSVLTDRGLPDALRSIARQLPIPVTVQASGVERFHQDAEVAVYFCCLEALQNVVKHGGADVSARMRLSSDAGRLRFEVVDTGPGFDPADHPAGHGLVNMRDRIEAVGGELTVRAAPGMGTTVAGNLPIA